MISSSIRQADDGRRASRQNVPVTEVVAAYNNTMQTPMEAVAPPSSLARFKRQLAPLASLDCSITEPITDDNRESGVRRSDTITDTPTLSGYFDCDQLSDRVDDSLFEITNAGCLSRSVFNRGSLHEIESAATSSDTNGMASQSAPAVGDDQEENGCRTPTNEPATTDHNNSNNITAAPQSPVRISKRPPILSGLPPNEAADNGRRRSSQVAAMLANHQPFDYSFVSSIPAQARGPLMSNGHRPRIKSLASRPPPPPTITPESDDTVLSSGGGRNGGDLQVERSNVAEKVSNRGRRKTRSNPDVREDQNVAVNENSMCPSCGAGGAKQVGGDAKKKERKRFTFSLFNLFISGGNSHGDISKAGQATCECPKRAPTLEAQPSAGGDHKTSLSSANRKSKSSAARKGAKAANSGPPIKTRDSIRLTNQRRQKSGQVKCSTSFNDFDKHNKNVNKNDELLLDLSRLDEQVAASRVPSSRSEYTIRHEGDTDRLDNLSDATKKSQRPTKSVKFTTPDRVMMIFPTGATNKQNQRGLSNPVPPAKMLPSAPIIKKCTIPKSSTYSQTESSKNLDELLAKYEGNHDLIMEINEKLKLIETIASPISALDQPVSGNETGPFISRDDDNQITPRYGFVRNDHNEANDDNDDDCSEQSESDIISCCGEIVVQSNNGNATSRMSDTPSKPDEAGLSKEWLNKQRDLN